MGAIERDERGILFANRIIILNGAQIGLTNKMRRVKRPAFLYTLYSLIIDRKDFLGYYNFNIIGERTRNQMKIIALLLAFVMAAAFLAGCGHVENNPIEKPMGTLDSQVTEAVTTAPSETLPPITTPIQVTSEFTTSATTTSATEPATTTSTTSATTITTTSETTMTAESTMPEFSVEDISETLYAIIPSNVRNGPSLDYDKIGTLRKGQKVKANGRASTGWYRIEYKGQIAYVSDKSLTEENPELVETAAAAESEPKTSADSESKTPSEEPESEIISVSVVPNTYSPEYSFIYENGLQYVWEHLECDNKENLRRVMTTLFDSQSGCDIAYGSSFDEINEMIMFTDQFLFGWPNQRLPSDQDSYGKIWCGESGNVTKTSDNIYFYSPETSKKMIDEIQAKVNEIVESAPSGTEREIIQYFYDTVILSCQYDDKTDNCGTAYGVFFDGRAKCEGYARAIQLLLSRAGFDVVPVAGMANGLHRWNKVRLSDGKWYNLDATWDDPLGNDPNRTYHDYFLISDEEIESKKHEFLSDNPFFYPPAA